MELDEFKVVYQARFDQLPDKSGDDLEGMLQRRSHSAIERILRNMLREVTVALVFVLILAFSMAIWSSSIFRLVGLCVLVLSIIQVIAFSWQYRQLTVRLTQPNTSVRIYLLETVASIERFVRLYFRYCLSSIPLGFLLGGYMGATADATDPAFSAFPDKPTLVFCIILLILSVLLVIATYVILKWYIHRLYGQYLKELNACLRDLNELPG